MQIKEWPTHILHVIAFDLILEGVPEQYAHDMAHVNKYVYIVFKIFCVYR